MKLRNQSVELIRYRIEVSEEDFDRITSIDNRLMYHEDTLCGKLNDEIDGIMDADYSGHFGCYIFYTVEPNHDNAVTRMKINQMIDDYLVSNIE